MSSFEIGNTCSIEQIRREVADMQFTKAEEYGLFGVMYLAQTERGRVVPLSEISEAQQIPEKFLAKIFQSLSRSSIVRSHRGVRGGFTLAGNAPEISMKQVLEAIQGPYHLMKCTENKEACTKNPADYCAVHEALLMAERRLHSVFEKVSLADLVAWQKNKGKPADLIPA